MKKTVNKEIGILMKPDMSLATLEDRKTHTRRVIKDVGLYAIDERYHGNWQKERENLIAAKCPYGKVGDRLYVRETHYRYGKWIKDGQTKTGRQKWKFEGIGKEVIYSDNSPATVRTKKTEVGWFKRPSLFMPRWASRITLEITDVRVERVQEISKDDAMLEGIKNKNTGYWQDYRTGKMQQLFLSDPRDSFRTLWNSINEKRGYGWDVNPWVWVIGFRRLG
ncbi:MAG: hypothetical protein KAU50_11470 [Candidatus Marinimicrobia bacterium]|nr:hypothetical protein [Candidatus Neomarinimicrobiota bacterium]